MGQDIEAMVCWDDGQADEAGGLPHGQAHDAVGAGRGEDIHYRLDVNTLHRDESAHSLTLNEVGPCPSAAHAAALLRQLPPQPDDGVVHRGQRADRTSRWAPG